MAERSRILVVDDETQVTRVLRTTLTTQGYEVKTCTRESGLDIQQALNRGEVRIFSPHRDQEMC